MTITPMDIHNKEFSIKMRGYDGAQVDSFLDEIIAAYSDALDRISDLEKQQEKVKNEVAEYEKTKQTINESLISAQESANLIKQNAQDEANKILANAKSTASKEQQEAEQKAEYSEEIQAMKQNLATLTADYERLKGKVADFRSKTKMLLQKEVEQLDDENWQYFLDRYYGTERMYPADGEPIATEDVTVDTNSGAVLDTNASSDVEFNHGDIGVDDEMNLAEQEIPGDGPVIVFPDDYKDHKN